MRRPVLWRKVVLYKFLGSNQLARFGITTSVCKCLFANFNHLHPITTHNYDCNMQHGGVFLRPGPKSRPANILSLTPNLWSCGFEAAGCRRAYENPWSYD